MLITRWNEASRALPVLTLKSNYLDRWPNDCSLWDYDNVKLTFLEIQNMVPFTNTVTYIQFQHCTSYQNLIGQLHASESMHGMYDVTSDCSFAVCKVSS